MITADNITDEQIRESGACAQCRSNALWNLRGGYTTLALRCLAYCAKGHAVAPPSQNRREARKITPATRISTVVDRHIDAVLEQHGGSISAAAKALGVPRSTIQRRLARRRKEATP